MQAAAKLGLPSVDVSGAAESETEAVQGIVDKKTGAATPAATVPVETVIVTPATPLPEVSAATTPDVAVSGEQYSAVVFVTVKVCLACLPALSALHHAGSGTPADAYGMHCNIAEWRACELLQAALYCYPA